MINTIIYAMFLATIPLANYMIGNFGECIPNGPCLIPVGFGLAAPSGVLVVGFALVLRDYLQERLGAIYTLSAILLGSVFSFFLAGPALAIASATAFLFAELLDFAIYTPLKERGKSIAVLLSGVVGALADSIIFTYLAFGAVEFSLGLFLGKMYATMLVSAFLFMRGKHAGKV